MSDWFEGPPLRNFVAVIAVALVGLVVIIVYGTSRPSEPTEEPINCNDVPASLILSARPYCEATDRDVGIDSTEDELDQCVRTIIEAAKSRCRTVGEW